MKTQLENIHMINPGHSYGPSIEEQKEEGNKKHICLPSGSLVAAAGFIWAGIEVWIGDENFGTVEPRSETVGIGFTGMPNIPEGMKLQQRIRKETNQEVNFLLGGIVVNGLKSNEFNSFFGEDSQNGNRHIHLKNPHQISVIPAYEKISDEDMREYLSNEIPLYLADGCKYGCSFCAANRSGIIDPHTGEPIVVEEKYRDPEILEKDLSYLVERAKRLGINSFDIYLSNLDIFQTPNKLLEFARIVKGIKASHPGFEIRMRALSGVQSIIDADKELPECIEEIIEAGFNRVGFGIDGWKGDWKRVGKGQNNEENCRESVRLASQYGLTPELILVFGHPKTVSEDSINGVRSYVHEMVDKYDAVPRPHVAKDFIPGNLGWLKPNKFQAKGIKQILKKPIYCQSLDFTAVASRLTHEDPILRNVLNGVYVGICEEYADIGATLWTKAYSDARSQAELLEFIDFNRGREDH